MKRRRSSARWAGRVALAAVVCAVVAGVGCASAEKGPGGVDGGGSDGGGKAVVVGGGVDDRGGLAAVKPSEKGLPTYAEIAAKHNERVGRLESFRASIELKMTIPDAAGKLEDYQSEGNLQFVRPSRLALRVDKTGQLLFWLGSDEKRFWWLDLAGETKTALVGTHVGVDRARVEEMGVPVRPLELLEVLGVLPWPRSEARARVRAGVGGVGGGEVLLDLPSGGTVRRMVLDGESFEPRRVEMIESGRAVLVAELERYDSVAVRDDVRARPTMARRVVVTVPATRTTLVMNLYNLENPGTGKIKAGAFDLENLARAYGVERLISVDRE